MDALPVNFAQMNRSTDFPHQRRSSGRVFPANSRARQSFDHGSLRTGTAEDRRSPEPKDKVTLSHSASSPESGVASARLLSAKFASNFEARSPSSASDIRSRFFKDPEHLQKLETSQSELKKAESGQHSVLKRLSQEQSQSRALALRPSTRKLEESEAKVAQAKSHLEQTKMENRRRVAHQKGDHSSAIETRKVTRGVLDAISSPGKPSAREYVDRIDSSQDAIQAHKNRSSVRYQENQGQIDKARSTIHSRYGEELRQNPELGKELHRFLELSAKGRLDSADQDQLKKLREKFAKVKDKSGEHTLGSDANKLRNAQSKERRETQRDKDYLNKSLERYKNLRADASKQYGRVPGLEKKIGAYREAKKQVESTAADGLRKSNEGRLNSAKEQLRKAESLKTQDRTAHQEVTEAYDAGPGAEDAKALKQKQESLISELEERVQDLSTIKSTDLSDGLRQSRGFGRSGEYDNRSYQLDGDQLKFRHNGTDFVARPTVDGGLNIEGKKVEGDKTTQSSLKRVPDGKGGLKTRTHRRTEDSPQRKSESFYREAEDGSRLETYRGEHKHSSDYFESRKVTGADGSEVVTANGQRRGQKTTRTSRKAPNGREETLFRAQDVNGPDYSETHTTTNPDKSQITRRHSYQERDWANHKNVEGASWLWKHSPQNLRNAIGDDAKYGRYTESTEIQSADGQKHTSTSERERWTSADGRRTLDAKRGQKGLPDTWTYTTKNGDRKESQTFLKGTEDTILNKEYTDRDGFRVQETHEDLQESAALYKEQTNKDMAESGHTTLRSKQGASLDDLKKLSKSHPEIRKLLDSESFKKFQSKIGDGRFDLAFRESEQTMTDDSERVSSQLTAMGMDGSTFTYMGGDRGSGAQYQEAVAAGKEAESHTTLYDVKGNRLEAGSDGKAAVFDPSGVRKALNNIDNLGKAGIRGANSLSKLPEMARRISRLGQAAKPGPLKGSLDELDKVFSSKFGLGVDALGAGLSIYNAHRNATQGDWGKAAGSAASALSDIGSLSKGIGQGWRAGSYVDEAGRAAKMWDKGATLSKVSRVGQLGKALGAAGAFYSAGVGVYDMSQGEYARGTLGMASAGGGMLALWGGTSWAGPVGWGVALAATAGIYTIDYVNGNEIAEPEIPLN